MSTLLTYFFLAVPFVGAYAIFALGISLIYRASRVLNLAHGAMAMVPAYLYYMLVNGPRAMAGPRLPLAVPAFLAFPVAVAVGAGLGVAVERVFVRRLRPQGPTAQTVGTVAVTGLLIALAAKVWGTTPVTAPPVFPVGQIGLLRYGDIGLLGTGVAVSAALFAFFRFTEVGLAMRGAAENRRAASLMGINPNLTASAAWALGGGLAGLAGVMLAAVTGLDPYNLSEQALPAFVATLIGGLESLPGALVGAGITGLTYAMVPLLQKVPYIGSPFRYTGISQLALTVLAMVVMAVRGRRFAAAETGEAGLNTGRVNSHRRRSRAPLVLGGLFLALWPLFLGRLPGASNLTYQLLGDANKAMIFALVAMSLVILIGWVGQISLAQSSFVGVAALATGIAARNWNLRFPVNMLVGAGIAAMTATLLGVVALRVRGLYLAVATLIFAWMADQFLFPGPWLGADGGSSTIGSQQIGTPGGFPFLDFTDRRTLYYVMVAVVVLVIAALSNLRDTRTGRAFSAVRGSEMAATSLGIDVTRYKLIAFALSGAMAGIAGNLLMINQRTVVPSQFFVTVSLQFLAISVVGGLGSLGGAVAAGVLFAALDQIFFSGLSIGSLRVVTPDQLEGWLDVVSALLLGVVLLTYPGGLAAAPAGLSRLWTRIRTRLPEPRIGFWPRGITRPGLRRPQLRLRRSSLVMRSTGSGSPLRRLSSRLPGRSRGPVIPTRPEDWLAGSSGLSAGNGVHASDPATAVVAPAPAPAQVSFTSLATVARPRAELPEDRDLRRALVKAEGITVRFGGLTAVNGASLKVTEGEVVGLIGPNGAGKTTFFNAILGLNEPAEGKVELYGHDVTKLPPHVRARLGVARTFQVIQLFRELTVFDNVLVATHLHNPSGLFSNLAASDRTIRAEREARRRVTQILQLLDLRDVANLPVQGLPFGVLRMVELARALVTGARVVMLDEPASGLNETETDRLSEVVISMRNLGVSVLLIEHDVRMVTRVSDYMYMLDQGTMIAEGVPAQIQRDPQVVAAYLGQEAVPA